MRSLYTWNHSTSKSSLVASWRSRLPKVIQDIGPYHKVLPLLTSASPKGQRRDQTGYNKCFLSFTNAEEGSNYHQGQQTIPRETHHSWESFGNYVNLGNDMISDTALHRTGKPFIGTSSRWRLTDQDDWAAPAGLACRLLIVRVGRKFSQLLQMSALSSCICKLRLSYTSQYLLRCLFLKVWCSTWKLRRVVVFFLVRFICFIPLLQWTEYTSPLI